MDVSLEYLKTLFEHQSLDDLLVTGYIDGGSSLSDIAKPLRHFGQFHALWGKVYLEVGQVLLRFSAIDASSKLKMEQVERIECYFDIDPDDTFGVMSMLRTILPSGLGNSVRVKQLDVYTAPDEPLIPGVVTALGLLTGQGDFLFFNPQDVVHGIHVGSERERDIWLDWVRHRYVLNSYPLGV
ncbi:hypothetical protein F0U62_01200 [Cystobacter fuscus]|uniref:hypothetical protein n=1 Tax=Cystobacter fuscus TaxID=43 RepID=UPI002B2C91C8|nr:hypothetical protein F0U62_01200 [Cystobacter fuscus]